jgi:hypothetical protein
MVRDLSLPLKEYKEKLKTIKMRGIFPLTTIPPVSRMPDSPPTVISPSKTPITWNPYPITIISIITGTIISVRIRVRVISRWRRCNYRGTNNHRRPRGPKAKKDPC